MEIEKEGSIIIQGKYVLDIVKSKKALAYEITKFIRGEEDAKLAEEIK